MPHIMRLIERNGFYWGRAGLHDVEEVNELAKMLLGKPSKEQERWLGLLSSDDEQQRADAQLRLTSEFSRGTSLNLQFADVLCNMHVIREYLVEYSKPKQGGGFEVEPITFG